MTTTSERKTHSIARKTHAAHSASTPTRASSSFTIRFGRAYRLGLESGDEVVKD